MTKHPSIEKLGLRPVHKLHPSLSPPYMAEAGQRGTISRAGGHRETYKEALWGEFSALRKVRSELLRPILGLLDAILGLLDPIF